MKTTKHKIILQAKEGSEWLEIATFDTNNRYLITKEQRGKINALKYEIENEARIVKRKIVITEKL